MTTPLGLVTVFVSDMQRMKIFYTEMLGFKVVPQFSSPTEDFLLLHTKTGGANLALQEVSRGTYGVPQEQHGGVILGFMVEDADAIYQDWQTKSADIASEIIDIGAGHMFMARDPEGNYVQIYHLYPQVLEMQAQLGLL